MVASGFIPWLNAPSSPEYCQVSIGQHGKKKILIPTTVHDTLH